MLPTFITRALIVCGALWCAAGITAVLTQPAGNNAQVARAASPAPVIEDDPASLLKGDRLAFAPFNERWVQPVAVERKVDIKVNTRPRHHDVDRVCGPRGRRTFTRHHHRYWRCRR
jgi:hypothetical protein